MRFRREPDHSTLQRQLRYAYVRLRKSGITKAEAQATLAEAEADFQWLQHIEGMPGER